VLTEELHIWTTHEVEGGVVEATHVVSSTLPAKISLTVLTRHVVAASVLLDGGPTARVGAKDGSLGNILAGGFGFFVEFNFVISTSLARVRATM